MDPENTGKVETTPTEPTGPEDRSYSNVLLGDGTTPEASPVSEDTKLPESQEATASKEEISDDPQVVLEIGGKSFSGSQSLFLKALELVQTLGDDSVSALGNAEKLVELKKNYDKGFTQKTQALAEDRKSLETAFGGELPNKESLASLGKLYQLYFQNPQVQKTIDTILSGEAITQGEPSNQSTDPAVQKLHQEIAGLKSQISDFVSSFQRERDEKMRDESGKLWKTWVAEKKTKGIEITEEIDTAMGPFIAALSQRYPDWDMSKILDEAFRHATIDDQTKRIAAKIIKDADKTKGSNPPKITPKLPQKPDTEKSYTELLTE